MCNVSMPRDIVLLLIAIDIAYQVKIMNSNGSHNINELSSSSLSKGWEK